MPTPDLPQQFLPFNGWVSECSFHDDNTSLDISYSESIQHNHKGIVVILPGLSEFTEKYIETTHDLNNKGYSVYIIDWLYQGRSARLESNPHKRHSKGFDVDVKNLYYFITKIIKPDAPLFFLGHSMGAHIGLRFLTQFSHLIKAASFSAPMLGIRDLRHWQPLAKMITSLFQNWTTLYVPGGHDWKASSRKSDGTDIFSSDPIRDQLHNAWSLSDKALQIGSPTMTWLYQAICSMEYLQQPEVLKSISIPCYIASAQEEEIVDNQSIAHAVKHLPNVEHETLPNAKHEILMETNDIRDHFLTKTISIFS